MQSIFPEKLKAGDEVRVIAPSRSLSMISEETQENANQRFKKLGLSVSFGKHVFELDDFISSSVQSRIEDLHEAFLDPNVKAIFAVIGGFNSNQMLDEIDWSIIQQNPKIFCGYSDITALQNAMYSQTGLVTYSGPHYSSFGIAKGFEYTLEYFKKCLFFHEAFEITPSKSWSDDAWYLDQSNREFVPNPGYMAIQEGEAQGKLLGGNLCTLNLLQGTKFFPPLEDSILFLEDDYESQPVHFDRDLQSLLHLPGFAKVKGLMIGRFQKKSNMNNNLLTQIVKSKKPLRDIPVLAGLDFGHTSPMLTLPIGGEISLIVGKESKVTLLNH